MTPLGEKIARVIAPQAVTLTTEHVQRLREEVQRLKKLTEFQKREIKRLRAVVRSR